MRKQLFILAVLLTFSVSAFAQLDSNWQALTSYDDAPGVSPYCYQAANINESGGLLTLSMTSGSYTCNGHSASYATGGVFTPSFSFSGGVVKARMKLGSSGSPIWNAVWMEAGASGSSGYPANCAAVLASGIDNPFSGCVSSAQTSYEIDIAESEGSDSAIWTNYIEWNSGLQTVSDLFSETPPSPPTQGFHIYEFDWYPTLIIYKMDGQILRTINVSIPSNVYALLLIDQEMHVVPGTFPNLTQVDWIRVCSDPNAACLPGDATMIFDDEFGTTPTPVAIPTQRQGSSVQGQTSQ